MCEIKTDYVENSFSNYFYLGKRPLEFKIKFIDGERNYIIPQKSFLDFVKESVSGNNLEEGKLK